jgi:TolA-binding protein
MLKPDFIKPVSDKVSHSVNTQIEAQITKSLNALTPAIAKTTAQTVHHRIVEDVNGRISEAFEQLDERRRDENAKLDRLIAQTQDLSNAISSLAASQNLMQQELTALKQLHDQDRERASTAEEHVRGHAHSHSGTGSRGLPSAGSRELVSYPAPHQQHQQHQQHQHQPAAAAHPHPAQASYSHQHQHQFSGQEGQVVFAPLGREERQKIELDGLIEAIDGLMRSGNYDEAMLRWLQSGDKAEDVFQQVLSNYNPIFVQELQPLLLLSVGATVSVDLSRSSQKLMKKVNLLEVVVYSFNQNLQSLVRSFTPFLPFLSALALTNLVACRMTKSGKLLPRS